MTTTKTKATAKKKVSVKKEKAPTTPKNIEATLYNQKGKAEGTITLPEIVFGAKRNSDMVHQVVTSILGNKRAGTADTKGRGEVRGGGIKPWKQKGTGRARHGSSRSPIWIGGGITHGPLAEKNYKRKINKKMKAKALGSVLSEKYKSGQVLFVKAFTMGAKTKEGALIVSSFKEIDGFNKIGVSGKRNTAFIVPAVDQSVLRPFRNIPDVALESVMDINPAQILNYKYIIIVDPEKCIPALEKRVNAK